MRAPARQKVNEPQVKANGIGRLSHMALKAGGRFLGRDFAGALEDMLEAQFLPEEQLRASSEARLQALLQHATSHVPFYRQLGIRPDLKAFPVLSKADYREHGLEKFVAENIPAYRHVHRATSGSTGQPFAFSLDRKAMPVIFASHVFYDSWIGLRPFDRYVRIASPPAPVPPLEQGPWFFRCRQELTRRLQRFYEARTQRKLSVWEVDAARAREIWREIEAFRPDFVMGYTSALAQIADELLERGWKLRHGLRGVITIAETLTASRRKVIERHFEAPITNRYGLREFGSWSAQSCEQGPERLHMNTELVVWEILRDDGLPADPGETGRVVLTDLWNYARPFIRYFTGDLAAAVPGRCPCGRGFPLMGSIEGRSQECLRTVSGKVISPAVLGHYLFVYHGHQAAVRDYQLVQEAANKVCLLVAPAAGWEESMRARIQRDLESLLGPDMDVRMETAPIIPLEKSGKRPIIKIVSSAPVEMITSTS